MYESGAITGLVSFDATLIFQIINTIVILAIFIGVPYVLFKYIRKTNGNNRKIDQVNKKVDLILEKLDKE
ncbi:DUF4083 domain-containing protein [Acidaminobacter sp. JC074]|uniref:DUF4083 family protein n=1 Tax=Acidaminobacter sp. JC074 TaxID=2530199 RepID=UPI001F0D2519|nr:DUF4083 family protein [Acidaminobacter sp. JC074]MCH4890106.1 DUF4083 domain-containing protein [Acidaminobacter sp. JC074]